MKNLFTLFACLCLTAFTVAETIYEVQYTTDPGGDGTYPSPLEGEIVTVSGIVTANHYFSSGYFIQDPAGGPWQGILVWDETYGMAEVGEYLEVTGEVYEYYGQTEINYVQARTQLSPQEPLPPAAVAASGDLLQEAYENVYSRLNGVTVTSPPDNDNQWTVDDGSGDCLVDDNLFDPVAAGLTIETGTQFEQLLGIVIWRHEEFALNPRGLEDFVAGMAETVVTVPELTVPLDEVIAVPISISSLLPEWEIEQYQFELTRNPAFVAYSGWNTTGTLSAAGSVTVVDYGSTLTVSYDSGEPLSGAGTLLELLFEGENLGTSPLDLENFLLGATPLVNLEDGQLEVSVGFGPVGDTLTIIQQPLLSIPALCEVGDTLEILCDADPATTGWLAEILHPAAALELPLVDAVYDSDLTWWRLQVVIPPVPFYEQYDLRITTDQLPEDISHYAVKILSQVPADFYFAHITDTHLPTHLYWYEPGSEADSSEMRDLRAVFDDLEIINPEFILLTGDYLNEGELEDFLFRRYYSRGKRILGESRVPVYLSAGNHDIGGWDETPPPDGTARRDWWRFFGWKLCDDPPPSYPYYTQNYSFDYGPLHVAMIEAYDNYDSWRYHIYGATSFTSGQLDWLEDDLAASSQPQKVIAYHMDFADQINLNSLGADIALWGHIHSSSGSIYNHPYNLSTDNVCDGARSFRLVRVSGDQLQPLTTMQSGGSGQNLEVAWAPANDGTALSVTATVTNQFDVDFPEGLLRFYLAPEVSSCSVDGGTLLQMILLPEAMECQVRVNLTASSSTEVTVTGVLGGPLNLVIAIADDQLFLNWEAFPGATGYRVYRTTEPYGPYEDVSGEGVFSDCSWASPLPPGPCFYRVTAEY